MRIGEDALTRMDAEVADAIRANLTHGGNVFPDHSFMLTMSMNLSDGTPYETEFWGYREKMSPSNHMLNTLWLAVEDDPGQFDPITNLPGTITFDEDGNIVYEEP